MHSLRTYNGVFNPDGTLLNDGQGNLIFYAECLCGQSSLTTADCILTWLHLHTQRPEIFS